jgi:rod shape-determining protein MreC
MQNLLRFLLKYHFFILFILIETFSIFLLINNNNYQNSKFVNFTRSLSGTVYDKVNNIQEYLMLREKNEKLAEENLELKNYISQHMSARVDTFKVRTDTIYQQQYQYIGAKVINNSINKQHNYLTLNKGTNNGIHKDMGVISREGIVGVVKGVSEHFATVISLLNNELKISAKHKESGYFGSLSWSGRDYQYAELRQIPLHTKLSKGDTVITSGYSTIFPEGVLIGYVEDWEERGGSFYEITVRLSTDFKHISEVYVIRNIFKEEQKKLERESTQND